MKGRPFSHVHRLMEQPDIFLSVPGQDLFNDLHTTVSRKIIDEDNLLFQISHQPDGDNPVQDGFYGFLLVIHRDDHR